MFSVTKEHIIGTLRGSGKHMGSARKEMEKECMVDRQNQRSSETKRGAYVKIIQGNVPEYVNNIRKRKYMECYRKVKWATEHSKKEGG